MVVQLQEKQGEWKFDSCFFICIFERKGYSRYSCRCGGGGGCLNHSPSPPSSCPLIENRRRGDVSAQMANDQNDGTGNLFYILRGIGDSAGMKR